MSYANTTHLAFINLNDIKYLFVYNVRRLEYLISYIFSSRIFFTSYYLCNNKKIVADFFRFLQGYLYIDTIRLIFL